jgi:hypothetical protein
MGCVGRIAIGSAGAARGDCNATSLHVRHRGSPDDRAAGIREQSVGRDALSAFLRVTTSGLGGALVLIAVGAILRYAISWDPASVDIDTVGLLLMMRRRGDNLPDALFVFRGRQPPGTMPPPYGRASSTA